MKKNFYFSLKNVICSIILLLCFLCIIIFATIYWSDVKKTTVTDDVTEEDKSVTIITPSEKEEGIEVETALTEALMMALGIGVEKNETAALAKFEDSVLQDNADSQYFAGVMYLYGIGAEVDVVKGGHYIQNSYQNGNILASYLYAQLAFLGEGVMQDYEAAVDAFLAVKDKYERVETILTCMSTYGMGMEVNANIDDLELHKSEFFEINYQDSSAQLKDLITQFYEQFDDIYEPFEQTFTSLMEADPTMASMTAIYGKDQWLFYKNVNDGESYRDYVGDNAFEEAELQNIADFLVDMAKQVESTGAEFVIMIIPNKEIVYSEYMPSYIQRVSAVTRTDKLVKYLKENTDITILYLKDKYMEYKDEVPLFYKTDTHFNLVGSMISVQELVAEVSDIKPQFNIEDFDIHMTDYCGDIAAMIGQQQQYSIDSVYFIGEDKIAKEDMLEKSLLLIGDSFSEFINMEAKYYFRKNVNHVMIKDYNYSFADALERNKGDEYDVVVFECVERYIQRLQKKQ